MEIKNFSIQFSIHEINHVNNQVNFQ